MGFAAAAIEAPDLGDDDVEDRRLGTVGSRSENTASR